MDVASNSAYGWPSDNDYQTICFGIVCADSYAGPASAGPCLLVYLGHARQSLAFSKKRNIRSLIVTNCRRIFDLTHNAVQSVPLFPQT